jgi:membrane-associated phospholipid phosphatase
MESGSPPRIGYKAPVRPRPLEALNLATLAILSVLTLFLWKKLSHPSGILIRYGVMAAALLLVVWLVPRAKRLPAALRLAVDFYPAAFIPLLYETLGDLIVAARGRGRDELLIAADRALFGVDVTVWMQRFVRPWISAFFYVSYTTYYFLGLALGILLLLRDKAIFRRYVFTLTFVYLVSYAGYFLLPALGPRVALAFEHTVPLDTTAVARAIAGTINELEHTKFDVFPSGHTMIALMVLMVSFRRARDFFWWSLPVAVCLIISTVYCRYHYAVDVIAGVILTLAAVPLGDWIYDRALRKSMLSG